MLCANARLPKRQSALPQGRGGLATSVLGTVTDSLTTYDPATGIETETVTSSTGPTVIRRSLHSILLSTENSGETTFNSYDAFGRVAATSRCIGEAALLPLQSYTYSSCGDLLAKHTYTNGTDIIAETYDYDLLGNRIATTDAHGNTTYRTYDPLGNLTAEWGATYPVRYTYDTQNRRTSLTTFRTTGGSPSSATDGDTTTWTHDPYTGNCLSKTYADGSTVIYTYTPDNLPLRTTYPSGKWKENVYDAQRRLCGVIYSSPDMDYELQLDEYGRTTYASNCVAQTCYAFNDAGGATNEVREAGNVTDRITRAFDRADRLTGLAMPEHEYEQSIAYSSNGLLSTISNSDAIVTYDYSDDLREVGYAIAFANGGTFVRTMVRDPFRRDLILAVTNSCGTHSQGIGYTYDALSRPAARNGDTFCYNGRSEVIGAIIDGSSELHEYDEIGNSTLAAYNFITNIYAANNVNQYTSILSASESPCEPTYDTDGNMTFDGVLAYSYDAENRLVSISSNGITIVTNQYDHKGRRVRKTTPTAVTTFLYDGWNLIHEHEVMGSATNEIFYYVPHYDAYGNVVRYTDTAGNAVAAYTYGAFGNLLSATGPLVDKFRFLFSTKYYDVEIGLYYYGYRFYSPPISHWLNRDPMEEEGGLNQYGFCANNGVCQYDKLGCAYFALRKLKGFYWLGPLSHNPLFDFLNIEIAHELVFLEDGGTVNDFGFSDRGVGQEDSIDISSMKYHKTDEGYNDCIMRKAIEQVKFTGHSYSVFWGIPRIVKCNCQDYASALRRKYYELSSDPKIRCECGMGPRKKHRRVDFYRGGKPIYEK